MAPRQGEGCLSPWPCPVALARVSFCRTRLARQIRPLSCPPLQTRRSLPLSLARTRCDGLATESHSRPCGPQFSHWSSRRPPPPSSLPYLPLFPYPLPPSPPFQLSLSISHVSSPLFSCAVLNASPPSCWAPCAFLLLFLLHPPRLHAPLHTAPCADARAVRDARRCASGCLVHRAASRTCVCAQPAGHACARG